MELFATARCNLILLMIVTIVLQQQVALTWSSSIDKIVQAQQQQEQQAQQRQPSQQEQTSQLIRSSQVHSPLFDGDDIRQPFWSPMNPRIIRSAIGSLNKIPFYPTGNRYGSTRLITPYALQHLLASRYQNNDYPGKRMGSEFLGKRSNLASNYDTISNDELSSSSSSSGIDSGSRMENGYAISMEKKMGSEFLGRRKRDLIDNKFPIH